ncbi:S8 family peptidase [Streptomyces sp. NPDC003691]
MSRIPQQGAPAALAVAALVAALTAPAAAASVPPPDPAAREGGGGARVVLVTGDTVTVDRTGRVSRIERAPGRERVPVRITQRNGRTLAVPADARPLIDQGRLDPRLFDITERSRAPYRQRGGLGLIVRYRGEAAAADKSLTKAAGADAGRELPRLNARTLQVGDAAEAARVWEALTDSGRAGTARTAAPGIDKVWLDAVHRASLERSAGQIGAPAAWRAGYDGTGVKIAVLDTGVDQSHPDLAGKEIAERNFSWAPGPEDRDGHGTHVASTAAGTGAKSGGRFKGIAPGARILDGKVLNDQGWGSTAQILAGIEWAVAQGADVVNLSLGMRDEPGQDPLEEAIDRISATTGVLFAVAAGNSGTAGVDSPGSAGAALTVGAVDHRDALTGFSARGPAPGDRGLKPDVTAPGGDIAAAVPGLDDPDLPGYRHLSGTSMATPHVAGAAALLKQKHPTWPGARLKAALTGSARPGPYTPLEQGHGRIDVAAALTGTVVADTPSLSFGRHSWPHHDDTPATRDVTYRNTGGTPVTLDLRVTGQGTDGRPTAPGLFTLSTNRITVPAGGTATARLTADTRRGTTDGILTAVVTAAGGGQSVRVLGSVEREVESYALTVRTLGRNGTPATDYGAYLTGLSGPADGTVFSGSDPGGTFTVRVPKGGYFLNGEVFADPADRGVFDLIGQPRLTVDRDTTVTVDARRAKPVRITGPDPAARNTSAEITTLLDTGGTKTYGSWSLASFDGVRIAHQGPALPSGTVSQGFSGAWTAGSDSYFLAHRAKGRTLPAGVTRHFTAGELATVRVESGSSVPGERAYTGAAADLGHGVAGSVHAPAATPLPETVTAHFATGDLRWRLHQLRVKDDRQQLDLVTPFQRYTPGPAAPVRLGVGVFGPGIAAEEFGADRTGALRRDGDTLYGCLPMFSDGAGRWGDAAADSSTVTLHRNGVKIRESRDPLCWASFTLPRAEASYRLTATSTHSGVSSVSTEVSSEWTFTSGPSAAPVDLPVSAVRFAPALALDSTAPAGARMRIPVTVEGAAAGPKLRSLTVHTSLDSGRTWTEAPVTGGAVTVVNPAAGAGIALRATVTDTAGNTLKQTIHNAYRGR